MKTICFFTAGLSLFILLNPYPQQAQGTEPDSLDYKRYPEVNEHHPGLPSPFQTLDHREFVVAMTRENQYAVMPVTLGNDRSMGQQLVTDTLDFPTLARTGLHSDEELLQTKTITGRTVEEITRLAMPGGLSQGGFMAPDETILSVLQADNETVRSLGLTHAQLARPLFHVLNMMDEDLKLNRWNMAHHRWEHITRFYYNDQCIHVDAEDTKGGQLSIFDDGIKGGLHIILRRDINPQENQWLRENYGHLPEGSFQHLIKTLSSFHTGEIEPQYIMRYGFYEGHTYWRTDPIAIAFIFGIKSLEEIEDAFPGQLFQKLTRSFTP